MPVARDSSRRDAHAADELARLGLRPEAPGPGPDARRLTTLAGRRDDHFGPVGRAASAALADHVANTEAGDGRDQDRDDC